jgi:streptogramin lyase
VDRQRLPGPLPTTDSNGSFSFANPACASSPSNTDQIYLVGTGGDPVAGNASNGGSTAANANLALMVALGACGNLNNITHIHMNELTTVAAVWALAPFMSGNTLAYQNVGTSTTNSTGLQMAFAAAGQVANIDTGTLPGTLPAGATLGTAEVNTVADALEACINSKGGTSGDTSSCGNLFAAAPSAAGNPTDTITAAMNIAQNPARNVTSLDSVVSNTSTFQPIVASPTAFTIAIEYTGGGLNQPTAIAADQQGQIWVTNSGSDAVSLFDNLGNSKLGTTGTTLGGAPGGVAIDTNGNAWLTASNNEVYELNSGGATAGTPLSGNGLNLPTSIAIDPNNNIWVVNTGSSTVSAFNSSGAALANSPFNGGGNIASPTSIAINGSANANCADCH